MRLPLILGLLSLMVIGPSAVPAQALPSVDMEKLPLSKTFVHRLRGVQKFGVMVVYPTFVPARYKLQKIEIGGDDAQHPDYALTFAGKGHHTLTVETAYTGIGDGPDGDKHLSSRNATFGKVSIAVFNPHSEGNGSPYFYYLSDWAKPNAKIKKDAIRNYHIYATGITDKEAVAILNSLTPVK